MNTWAARNFVYLPVQRLRGQHVARHLSDVRTRERLTRAELLSVRDSKIRGLVGHAYSHVPFYRGLFDSHGIAPEGVTEYGDLRRLPILSKRQILENGHGMLAEGFRGKVYERKTSGSTGLTLHFQKEAAALSLNDAIMYRCYSWYDIEIGDRQARFWGVPVVSTLRLKERLKDLVANRIRISAFDISESTTQRQYRRILRFKPAYFYGYTSAIYGFAIVARKMGLDLGRLELKAVICTAEKMYPQHRSVLEEAFSCPVVDEYGSSENGVIAFQCRMGKMHMMADHLAIEFVNSAGEPVRPGELGRIVITDLSGYVMPLIRYEIGDMGCYSEGTCSCGNQLPLMDVIEGRTEDFIRTESGTLVHAAYLCYTLKDDAVTEFKMYQKALDSLVVQIVRSSVFSDGTERRLERNMRTALGEQVRISFEYVDAIPREPSGKLRYFVSELGGR